jgi:hypothetical protein
MSVLSRAELLEACRGLYAAAAKNFILPPLIRDAGSDEELSHSYSCALETGDVVFKVAFDHGYAEQVKPPWARLPLRFSCFFYEPESEASPTELTKEEYFELLRAFFLGVKAPIHVERKGVTESYGLSIQLTSAFFVECGELPGYDPGLCASALCCNVALGLYQRSSEFFSTQSEALAVWTTRAAQELFDEPKPQNFSLAQPDDAEENAAATGSGEERDPAQMLPHTAACDSAFASETDDDDAAASAAAAPPRQRMGQRAKSFAIRAAAAGMVGFLGGFAASQGGPIATPPQPQRVAESIVSAVPAIARESSPARVETAGSFQATLGEALRRPEPRVAGTLIASAWELAYAPPAPFVAAPSPKPLVLAPFPAPRPPGLGGERKKAAAPKTPPTPVAKQNNPQNPPDALAAMGKVMKTFAVGVVKKLQHIPEGFNAFTSAQPKGKGS